MLAARYALLLLLVAGAGTGNLAAQAGPAAPLAFIRSALARHPVVFLGDIHPLAEPKRLVEQIIAYQDREVRVDLLALEVASEHQDVIDRYLASSPEDTSILLAQPRTLRAHWGASAEYLAIYRAVYRWNRERPDRRVRILAADVRGWPMAPLTRRMAAGGFATRDRWMADRFREVLAEGAGRVLVFMGGYHGLKAVGGRVTVGGATQAFDRWFAGYLEDEGAEIYTILTDARQPTGRGATRVYDRLIRAGGGNRAVELDSTTDAVAEPLWNVEQEGYALEFVPARFALRRAVDAMLLLEHGTPTTPLGR